MLINYQRLANLLQLVEKSGPAVTVVTVVTVLQLLPGMVKLREIV